MGFLPAGNAATLPPAERPARTAPLPATLDETYARVLKEIGKTNQFYAHRLLQCLTVAKRPLRVDELAEILALNFTAEEGIPELKENWRWKDEEEAVLSTCSSLISVVGPSFHRVVQFSHFSVKEFLTSDRLSTSSADISYFHILSEPAHTITVEACLGVLLRSQNGASDADTGNGSPLTIYAAQHWVEHIRCAKVWPRIEDAIQRLFDPAKPHLEAWLKLLGFRHHPSPFFPGYEVNRHSRSPLYYASLFRFRDLARLIMAESPQHVTGPVGRNPSPLVAALGNRHFDIAELLYQRGIDLGIRDDNNKTLLHAASEGGYVDIVQWLFDHSVPANSKTPLYLAEANGHQGHGITVDDADDTNHTPLHWASQGGHFEIVRLLLMRGADVTTRNQFRRSPLHLVSYMGDSATVRLLTEHGADVTAQDRRHRTPLHLASLLHDKDFVGLYPAKSGTVAETVRLLINHGADVTALDTTHSTPLHLVLSLHIREIVQILIENGVDVDVKNETHSTPLHQASSQVDSESVRILIEHGADVTARDWNHKTPLHIASSWDDRLVLRLDWEKLNKKIDSVRLLIEHGADVTATDRTHSMSLH
ncbi:ankyrin repeat-containing domain protein [Lactarius deliciosus]|nr:ankyrin repeat-containing domain protein [Lactarius deliciosus]